MKAGTLSVLPITVYGPLTQCPRYIYFDWLNKERNHGVYVCAKSLQLCPTLCDAMDYSPPGSSVHGIPQARMLEGLPWPPPGDLPDPRIELTSLMSPALAGGPCCSACGILVPQPGLNPYPVHGKCRVNHWTTREVPSVIYFDSRIYDPLTRRGVNSMSFEKWSPISFKSLQMLGSDNGYEKKNSV